MNKPVNTIKVYLYKYISDYNLKTGEVGMGIHSYTLFNSLEIIPDTNNETIKATVLKHLKKNYVDMETFNDGIIFEESRIDFQSFEDAEGCTWNKETPYFVDNSLYIEVNNGFVSTSELKEIFPEIDYY